MTPFYTLFHGSHKEWSRDRFKVKRRKKKSIRPKTQYTLSHIVDRMDQNGGKILSLIAPKKLLKEWKVENKLHECDGQANLM